MTTNIVDWESEGTVTPLTIYTFHYFCPVTESTHKIWGLTSSIAIFASCVAHNKPPQFDYYFQPCTEVDNKIALIYYFFRFDTECNHIVFCLLSPHSSVFEISFAFGVGIKLAIIANNPMYIILVDIRFRICLFITRLFTEISTTYILPWIIGYELLT